jgi:hypothetical protein
VLILEIALGVILAVMLIAIAPILLGGTLGAAAHLIVALTKPRRGILTPMPGQTRRQRQIASLLQLGGVAVAFAVLCLIGAINRHLS